MGSYLDWARHKLNGAPQTGCAFWIDPERLLSGTSADGLNNTPLQTLTDDTGRDWQVVRYLGGNPFPARRSLADSSRMTIVWCPGSSPEPIDLTAFEDYLNRAWVIVDIGLAALTAERHPRLELPRDLGQATAGISFEVDAYVDELAKRHQQTPVTMVSAMNTLVQILTRRSEAIETHQAWRVLASTASCMASADSKNVLTAVARTLKAIAAVDGKFGRLCRVLASSDPADIVATAYLGSGMARLGVPSIGPVLVAESFCPSEVRAAFEDAGGRWSDFAKLSAVDDLAVLASRFEPTADATFVGRLRKVLAGSPLSLANVADEPLAVVRLAGIAARFDDFLSGTWRASAPGLSSERFADDFRAFDLIADALRLASKVDAEAPPQDGDLLALAHAFAATNTMLLPLTVERAVLGLRTVQPIIGEDAFRAADYRLDAARADSRSRLDNWDAAWCAAIASDVEAFLTHPRQGWRRAREFANGGSNKTSWLLVFDGLRYDLWKMIVAPALERCGWRMPEDDVSFSYLPSITEVSRRTLVGGSRAAARTQEESSAQQLADAADATLTYAVRTEHFGTEREQAQGWNVRVFSWPDKLVHSDLADLGTLAAQFESWVQSELVPWIQRNIPKTSRLAASTDHGFAALDSDDAIAVDASDGEERSLPRAMGRTRTIPADSFVVSDGSREVVVATSRRWFRAPGGRHWRFAHGGATLHEVLVPFAELVPIREGAADIVIAGLPDRLELEEGTTTSLTFTVRVTGGGAMFPTVTVSGLSQLLARHVDLGSTTTVTVNVPAEERLRSLTVVVQAGPQRVRQQVPVTVRLGKIKRETLDLDS